MAIFLPTDLNICNLKSFLMNDFEMTSCHSTEAIASLMGFASHSAFRSSWNENHGITVYEADFARFEERCSCLGYDRETSEYLRYNFTSIDWPNPIWRWLKKRDWSGREAWFHECQSRAVPFITITKARKYCTVEWDHITLDREYDALVRGFGDGFLGKRLFKNYQSIARGSEPKSFFDGTAFVGSVRGLSEPSARQVANMLATWLYPGNVSRNLESGN